MEEIPEELVKGPFDMLGYDSDFGADGHEVVIILPSRNKMEMEVVGDAGSGSFPQVEADVDAVGAESSAQDGATGGEHLHEALVFLAAQFGEVAKVAPGSQEQVPIGIGKAVEEDHR
jgi:hypothetical protein